MKYIYIFVAALLVWGCGSEPPSSTQSQSTSQAPTPQSPAPEPPPKVVKTKTPEDWIRIWPEPDPSIVVELADNIYAWNYLVIFDGSGSMNFDYCGAESNKIGRKANGEPMVRMDLILPAAQAFVDKVPPDANLGFMKFEGGKLYEVVPLGLNNRQQVKQEMEMVKPKGGTPLKSSIREGYKILETQARRQDGYGHLVMLVVTDGAPSDNEDPVRIAKQVRRISPVRIDTIGLCQAEAHRLNIPGYTNYYPADDPDKLDQSFAEVLAEAETFENINLDEMDFEGLVID